MDLWHILVLGIIRMDMDCSYDYLCHIANYDIIVRKILGVDNAFTGGKPVIFTYRTIHENVSKLDLEMIEEINSIVGEFGHCLFKKKIKNKI